MLLENAVWHTDQYIPKIQDETAIKKHLTITESASIAEEEFISRVAVSFSLPPLLYQFSFIFLCSLSLRSCIMQILS